MPLIALGLIVISATMHASWNVIVKRARDKQVFIWWAILAGILSFAFFFVIEPPLPARVWPYVISSAVMEALYYIALTWAYDSGDFSLIYPLARGAAPALLALWTTLFLAEPPRAGGIAGLALLILGLIIVGGSPLWARWYETIRTKGEIGSLRATFSTKGMVAALAAAVCVSIYTAIDGAAVRFAPPISYSVLTLGLTFLLFAPVVIFRYGTRVVLTEWRLNWWRIILVGVLMLLAYVLVLHAYTLSRISYAGAVREVSVVFGALAGWRLLGESFGVSRTIGAILIFSGIVVIAIAG